MWTTWKTFNFHLSLTTTKNKIKKNWQPKNIRFGIQFFCNDDYDCLPFFSLAFSFSLNLLFIHSRQHKKITNIACNHIFTIHMSLSIYPVFLYVWWLVNRMNKKKGTNFCSSKILVHNHHHDDDEIGGNGMDYMNGMKL